MFSATLASGWWMYLVFHQKPPALVNCTLLQLSVVCMENADMSASTWQPLSKQWRWKVRWKMEMEKVRLQSKSCTFWKVFALDFFKFQERPQTSRCLHVSYVCSSSSKLHRKAFRAAPSLQLISPSDSQQRSIIITFYHLVKSYSIFSACTATSFRHTCYVFIILELLSLFPMLMCQTYHIFFLKVLEIITISSINTSHSFQTLSSVLIIFHF